MKSLVLAGSRTEIEFAALLLDLVGEDTDVPHVDTFTVEDLGEEETIGDGQSTGTSFDKELLEDDFAKVLTRETNILGRLVFFVVDLD